MLLYTYNWAEIGMWILIVLSIATIAILFYRRLLMRLNRDNMNTADYCVLYSLENERVKGEVELYFTTEQKRVAKLVLLNNDMDQVLLIREGEFTSGGNIVRFDTTAVPDGNYFYALITDNQKTMKKMHVQNS